MTEAKPRVAMLEEAEQHLRHARNALAKASRAAERGLYLLAGDAAQNAEEEAMRAKNILLRAYAEEITDTTPRDAPTEKEKTEWGAEDLLAACEAAREVIWGAGWPNRQEAETLKKLDAAIEKARRGEGEAKMPAEVATERPAAEYRMDEAAARIEEIDAELTQLKQERDQVVDVAMEARELLLKKADAAARVVKGSDKHAKGSDKHAVASPRSASDEQLARLAELADEIYEDLTPDMDSDEWLQRAWSATSAHMSEAEADELIAEFEFFMRRVIRTGE